MNLPNLVDTLSSSSAIDLAQPYYVGMPHHPNHPPFLFSLLKKHGDYVTPGGTSSAAEAITMGGHVGTHVDSLCHFSCNGYLYGGIDVATHQSYGGGLGAHTVDQIPLMTRRGVLLDIAGAAGVRELPEDFTITPEWMEKAEALGGAKVGPGDICLLRTGWGGLWHDAARFIRQVRGPGPELEGAEWLSSRKVYAAGADTVAFEKVPSTDMPVHVHLLVKSGIYIIEMLNLEQLAAEKVYEFLFVASALRIQGATGSPIRPFALRLG